MKNRYKKARIHLHHPIRMGYIGLSFGIFLILWRVYYFFIGYPVRLWVTIFWLAVALWIIVWMTYEIIEGSKLNSIILCEEYEIAGEYLFLKSLNGQVWKIHLKNIRGIVIGAEDLGSIATPIYIIKDGALHIF